MTELTLYNGDCLEVMKGLPEKSVDLIICDLPYGCLSQGNPVRKRFIDGKDTGTFLQGDTIGACSWDVKIDLKAFWEQVKRIRKSEHSPTIHFCTTKFGYELIQSNPDEFRYDLVWDKQRGVSFLSANKMPMRSHEMIYIFSKAGAFYQRKDIEGEFKAFKGVDNTDNKNTKVYSSGMPNGWQKTENDGTKRCVLSVIKNKTSTSKGGHPTEKPEDLYRFLIERYCPPGGTVLDPTFGSGNSVFTAFSMGRTAIGIEKDTSFYTKAEKRLEAL
jgi:site-specific DNA-methyltransferase (adenine-specific)